MMGTWSTYSTTTLGGVVAGAPSDVSKETVKVSQDFSATQLINPMVSASDDEGCSTVVT
jgi:hypothetical protein